MRCVCIGCSSSRGIRDRLSRELLGVRGAQNLAIGISLHLWPRQLEKCSRSVRYREFNPAIVGLITDSYWSREEEGVEEESVAILIKRTHRGVVGIILFSITPSPKQEK